MTPPLVTIRDLRVRLGGNNVLGGVNAALARGKITAVIGMNGSGKTTLLRSILKEVPYSGTIQFHCGHDHSRPSPQHIGYVPQKLAVDAHLPLTVLDLFGLALQRWPLFLGVSRRVRELTLQMLQRVGKPEVIDRPVAKLSGGELQRVLLALAIEPKPELLLLDEPSSGVDAASQEQFYDLIARLNREDGATVLLVSHELNVVTAFAHQVLCLRDGLLQCQGPPREVLTGELLAKIFGTDRALYVHHHHHAPVTPPPS
jgi:zinc transport system ATP-binding protein